MRQMKVVYIEEPGRLQIEKTNELSGEEKAMFLGLNAAKFYGFDEIIKPVRIKNMLEE